MIETPDICTEPASGRVPRTLFLLPSFDAGGAERVMITLAKDFIAHEFPVEFAVQRRAGALLTDAEDVTMVHGLSPGARLSGLTFAAARKPGMVPVLALGRGRVLRYLSSMVALIERERPDAIVSGVTSSNLLAGAAMALSRHKPRLVLSEHNMLSHTLPGSALARRRTLAQIRQFYLYADALVGVSNGVSRDLEGTIGLPENVVRTIYNPICGFEMEPSPRAPAERQAIDPGSERPAQILAVGRMVPQKGFDILIDAFSALRARRSAHLTILGDGPLQGTLKEQVRSLGLCNDVSMPGYVANPALYFQSADLFVMSSRHEGFGNVIVEALSVGCPVVSTDCPSGPSEILDNGRYGRLVPVENTEALAEAMVLTLTCPPNTSILIDRSRKYSPEAAGRSYRRIISLQTDAPELNSFK